MSRGKYYLTTPIYYVNAAPHVGHAYTTIAAETIARLKRLQGFDVVLTTGTDEHGTKVERAAAAQKKTPEAFVDLISGEFRAQWDRLNLRIDRFKRTTEPDHAKLVNQLFEACKQNGFIYKGTYTGLYAVVSESFVTDAKPGDIDPETGKPYEQLTEENYFFKLSAFSDRLLEFYETHRDFIQPEIRRNEVLAFVRQGLADLSITRTSIKWGVPVDSDPAHVFYVWFDALTTYVSAVANEGCWPADLHLIGKEILRFHAVYWPAFLMAAGWELPRKIFAHGWLLFENDKMSKSRGNLVRASPIADVMGADALRYFLLREIVFGQDGSFSFDALVGRYNADLANGLGNLASRTLNMISQYRGGKIPQASGDRTIAELTTAAVGSAMEFYERFEFSRALEQIWSVIAAVDKYIVEQAPWKIARSADEAAQGQLDETLYTAAEALRIVCILAQPVLPRATQSIWQQLGFESALAEVEISQLSWGAGARDRQIGAITGVFPRVESAAAVAKMQDLEAAEKVRQATLMGHSAETAAAAAPNAPALEPTITIDDFAKVDLRVGEVRSAEPVKGAEKLLHLKVDLGEPEPRTIVAGIATAYRPEQLIGRKVVVVANLAPRKLRGITSQGMLVAASVEGGLPVLAGFADEIAPGARLK